jgi:hypothetical protein
LREPDKCSDSGWFARSDLPEELVPYIRTALESGLDGDGGGWIQEIGW